jgi:uncharacterized protein (TIGR03067 family)
MGGSPSGSPSSHGTWRQVAAVVDGRDVPVGRGTLLTVTPNGYTVSGHGRVYQTGTSRADYAATPHHSDVTVTGGRGAGQTLRQIFRVEGDVLVACNARPGAPRPAAFASPPGSGHTLSVWVRVPDRPTPTLSPAAWWTLLILALVVGGGVAEAVEKELVGPLGVWGALGVRCVLGGACVGGLALLLARLRQADPATRAALGGYGLLFGAVFPLVLGVYENLRKLLEPEHGWLGWGLALLAATAVGLAASAVLTAVLRRVSPGSVGE